MFNRLILFILLLIHAIPLRAQFIDVSDQLPREYIHISPNMMGGGVGVIDINADGLEDLYLTGGSETDALLLNTGRGFADISVSSQVFGYTALIHTTGIAVGDVNNDGYDDIFLTTTKNFENKLLINQGDDTFEDATRAYQVPLDKVWSMAAAMGDVNGDGLLDIYVGNYIDQPKAIIDDNNEIIGFEHQCTPNILLINRGGYFEDRSAALLVDDSGCALASAMVDINEDGFTDIYVANDFGIWVTPNKAFINDGNGGFTENSIALNLSDSIYAMGISFADLNGDLKKDYYITNLGRNSLRLSQQSDDAYIESADDFGVSNTRVTDHFTTGWGTVFIDIENDGKQDLFVANGFIPSADFIKTTEEDPNKLYFNTGNGFEDISQSTGLDNVGIARGSVKADFNNDGYYDLAVANIKQLQSFDGTSSKIYINDADRINNWLGLVLKGSTSNLNAFGSKVFVYTGNSSQYQELSNSGSHASASTQRLIFGLNNTDVIDSVHVIWPNGTRVTYEDFKVNGYYEMVEGDNKIVSLGCGDGFDKQWGCPTTVTSISNPQVVDSFILYPNPAYQWIFSKSNLSKLEMADVSGALVMTYTNIPAHERIDISRMSKGIYVLSGWTESGDRFFQRIKKD